MSTRTQRVEQMLRRSLADILIRGELRDPRLRNVAAISITAVKVSPDLGSAQVYVDVIGSDGDPRRIVEALNAGSHAIRSKLGGRIRLKRTPSLRFLVDESIEQGRRIEAVLAELHAEEAAAGVAEGEGARGGEGAERPSDGDGTEGESDDVPEDPDAGR
ncbi:MAG: 30S ribosome-binding factor RbfA [Myxococcales bacterium]|nr:30S ribosome-binding factor RbfA [Myxococcales bacterium]MCB9713738.1 30S ribosome-binding factor RbfA [Myxococcales bacterium]